jgi:predicted O-methyltransferase YrrM
MDAAKGQYPILLPTAVELLDEDGVLVTDNVLFDGEIIESRYAVTRRNRTIHKRMRDYLYTLTHHELLQSTVLPVGDGAAVSVKIRR